MKNKCVIILGCFGILLTYTLHPQPSFYKNYGNYLKAAGAATAAYLLYKYYYPTEQEEPLISIETPASPSPSPLSTPISNMTLKQLNEITSQKLQTMSLEQQREISKRKSNLIEQEKKIMEQKQKRKNKIPEKKLVSKKLLPIISEGDVDPPVQNWLKNNCSDISFNYLQSVKQRSHECGSFALFNAHALQQVYNTKQAITSQNIKEKFTPILAMARAAYQEFKLPVCLPENIQAYEILGVQKFINEFAKTKNWDLLPPFTNLFFFNVTGTNIQIVYPSEEKTTFEKKVQLTKTEIQRFDTAIKKENGIIHCLVRYASGEGGHFVLFSIIKTKGQRPSMIFLNSKNPPLVKESGAFKFIEYICKRFNKKEAE